MEKRRCNDLIPKINIYFCSFMDGLSSLQDIALDLISERNTCDEKLQSFILSMCMKNTAFLKEIS